MSWMNKVERYVARMGIERYERYADGFIIHVPGKERMIKIHVVVKEPYLGIKAFFKHPTEDEKPDIYGYYLRLNALNFMVKWYIDEDGDVYVATERLLRDMQFSEFEAAVKMVAMAYEENIEEESRG